MPECPLCYHDGVDVVLKDENQTYLYCSVCTLHFVHPDDRLESHVEKSRYDLHENDPEDPQYRSFLNQLFEPVRKKITSGSTGLDYGSGPGPTLHLMFKEAGFNMAHFDPFYQDDHNVLNRKYDFITVSETAEHFYHPGKEFDKLWQMLNPGGVLGIMTLMLNDPDHFKNWHYRRDDTHVAFYQPDTFRWISSRLNAETEFHGNRVVLLMKTNSK